MLASMEILFSCVILPLIVFMGTIILCGSSRPKHEPKGIRKSSKASVQTKRRGSSKSKKLSGTQKTSSVKDQSSISSSISHKPKNSLLKSNEQSKQRVPTGLVAENIHGKGKELQANIGDERLDLKMEPVELRWNTDGGIQKLFISNPTNERRALKVKCSDNNLYRVNPVYSFIEPGQVLSIDIVRQSGSAKVDKMVFLAAKAQKDDQNPRAVFQDSAPKPMMVLPLIATSAT